MEKNKSKLVTIVLIIMTIFLMGAIFYLGYFLTQTPDISSKSSSSSIAPKKTKAQVVTSEKFIALNPQNNSLPTPTSINIPTVTPTNIPTIPPTGIPTPTEIILAYSNQTITASPTASASPTISTKSATLTPTKIDTLPLAGYINSALIIFGLAGLLIFYSFIF